MSQRNLLEPSRDPAHLSSLDLERAAFNDELSKSSHLENCAQCRQQVEALKVEREAFLKRRPARPFLAVVRQAAESEKPKWWSRGLGLRFGFALAAAATVAVVMVAIPRSDPDSIAFRGNVSLEVLRSRGGAPAEKVEDKSLKPGDILRFRMLALDENAFAFVASIDAQGHVSRYFPAKEPRAVAVRKGEGLLPGAVELDDQLGAERIFLIISKKPLDETTIFTALEASFRAVGSVEKMGAIQLDARVVSESFTKVSK